MYSTENHLAQAHDNLLQYANTVEGMHKSMHKIFANNKAISESLSRTAAALRSMAQTSNSKESSRMV
jgi:hypothetical protein